MSNEEDEKGSIHFQILEGTNVKLDDKEEYYIFCKTPDSFKSKTLRSPTCGAKNLAWNYSKDIEMRSKLPSDGKIKVGLYQKNIVADSKIAKCVVELSDLARGGAIESVDYSLMSNNDAPEEVAKVKLIVKWKDMPTGMVPLDSGGGDGGGGSGLTEGVSGGKGKKLKPLPDCKDQDYSVRVWLHKAANLQSLKDDALYDPQGVVEILSEKMTTETQQETNEPTFDEELSFQFNKVKDNFWREPITISLKNSKTIGLFDEKIGQVVMDCATVYREDGHFMQRKWLILNRSETDGSVMGFLKASVAVLNSRTDPFPEIDDEEDDEGADQAAIDNLVSGGGSVFEEVNLSCEVVRAEGLPPMDSALEGGLADPYVKFIFGKKSVNTIKQSKTLNPTWNTNVMLPVRLPSLTGTILCQIYDYDAIGGDDLSSTAMLNFTEMVANGESGRPRFPAQWVTMYGHPRPNDADFNSYFKKMSKGRKPGIDYRGRLLLRCEGVVGSDLPSLPPIRETLIDVHLKVQLMQLNMVPDNSRYKMRVSIGTTAAMSLPMDAVKMLGTKKLSCVYIGTTLQLKCTFSIIAPEAEVDAPVVEQIPDVILQLVEDGAMAKALGSLSSFNPLASGGKDEVEPYASARISVKDIMAQCTDESVYYNCQPMYRSVDAESSEEGRPPANPIAQIAAGLWINNPQPDHPSVEVSDGLAYWPSRNVSDSVQSKKYILETCIYQARQVPAGDDTGLSDPFIRVSWANATVKSGVKLETLSPQYHEMVRVIGDAREPFPDIVVEVWDWDQIGRNTFLCKKLLSPPTAGSGPTIVQWYDDFTDSFGNSVPGCALLLSFKLMAATEASMRSAPAPVPMVKKLGKKDTYDGIPIPRDRALPVTKYRVNLIFYGLRKMRKFRLRELQKPSVEVSLGGHNIKLGKAVGHNPDFNIQLDCIFELPVEPKFLPQMVFRVFDHRIGPKVLIGACVFDCDSDLCVPEKKELAQVNHDLRIETLLLHIAEAKQDILDGVKPKKFRPVTAGNWMVGETDALRQSNVAELPDPEENPTEVPPADPMARDEATSVVAQSARTTTSTTAGGAVPRHKNLQQNSSGSSPSVVDHQGGAAGVGAVDYDEPLLTVRSNRTGLNSARGSTYGTGSNVGKTKKGPVDFNDKPETAPLLSHRQQADPPPLMVVGPTAKAPAEAPAADHTAVTIQPKATDEEINNQLNGAFSLDPTDVQRSLTPVSEATTEPEEELWFDKYDPEGLGADIPPDLCVNRFGQLNSFGGGKTELEDYFGPFNDNEFEVELSRGWGKGKEVGGKGTLDIEVIPLPDEEQESTALTHKPEPKAVTTRTPVDFICRVYILCCKNLAAKDDGPLGNASDPYVVLKFTGSGGDGKRDMKIGCKDKGKFQTLNPEFYFMVEVKCRLPWHGNLKVTVFDADLVGRDEEIGSTEINLTHRWYSRRGYQHQMKVSPENPNPRLLPGSYTEVRTLRNKGGQQQGQIEMWVDMFEAANPEAIPRPIDVTPPPPVELEVRPTIWNARDVELVDISMIGNEMMVDIYIRAWLDGMMSDMQSTDVHYRSLDGSGSFNWRMNFRCLLDPRTKKVTPIDDGSLSLKSIFNSIVKKEQKKYKPLMHMQIFDNDLLPGSDDFIGEVNVDLTAINPTKTRRPGKTLGYRAYNTLCCTDCTCWPLRTCICCRLRREGMKLPLAEKQKIAFEEAQADEREKRKEWEKKADQKLQAIRETQPDYTEEQLKGIRKRLVKEQRKLSTTNIFEEFLPKKRKKKDADKPIEEKPQPKSFESPKFWLPCRGPFGGGRIGDVQVSFEVVKVEAIKDDPDTYSAGKGRSEPQAHPEPDRPKTSFFWLSSPWKSAVHILWKNYKWYLFTAICIISSIYFTYIFLTSGVQDAAVNFFGGGGES